MDLDLEWLEKVLKEKKTIKNMVKVLRVNFEPAVAEGSNYTSYISRVKLVSELSSGEDAGTSLILKRKEVEELKKSNFLESHFFFETEVKIYTEVLPALEEVLREQGVPLLWPELLGTKDNILIFSDLKNENYIMQCRKERLDMKHILLVVRKLAYFHGGSIVLRQRGLWDPSNLQRSFFTRGLESTKRFSIGGLKIFAAVMAEDWGPKWSDIAESIQKKAEICVEELQNISEVDESRLNVLCHGDLWTTNMLFKYSQDGTPIDVKFIDFQLSHYNTYAWDLHYFLMGSAKPGLYKSNYNEILATYTEALRDSLTFHGFPELAPTLAEVQAEMSRTELVRVMFTISCMPVMTAECENAFKLEVLSDHDGIAHNPNIYRRKTYKEEIQEELLAWEKAGFF